jgi:hypothetical protein
VSPQLKFQLKIALGVVLMLVAYCAGSGRVDLWPGWCYAGFFLMMLMVSHIVLRWVAPDLIRERVSVHAGTLRGDTGIVAWLAISPLVACLVAGMDARQSAIDFPSMWWSLATCWQLEERS